MEGHRLSRAVHFPNDLKPGPSAVGGFVHSARDSSVNRESVSKSEASAPVIYNKVLDFLQTLLDAAGSTVGSSILQLSIQEVNRILEANGVLPLVGPREGYETDQASQHETDGPTATGYTGPNGDDIRSIDLQLVLLRRQCDVPPDLVSAPKK